MITLRPRLNPGLLHFSHAAYADTSDLSEKQFSEIFILVFYTILGVVRKGVSWGSPWTGP